MARCARGRACHGQTRIETASSAPHARSAVDPNLTRSSQVTLLEGLALQSQLPCAGHEKLSELGHPHAPAIFGYLRLMILMLVFVQVVMRS